MSFKDSLKLKTHRFFVWLTLGLGMIFTPIRRAGAQFGIEILTAPLVFLAKLVTFVVIMIWVSFGALSLGQIFLSWASNPNLVGRVTQNPFVQAGWTTIRDFSNLFFILIMVAIGVATALRIKQYEVRKTLPRLVLIALLINFSPVICGAVIDVANILMRFFLTAGGSGLQNGLTLVKNSGSYLENSIRSAGWSDLWTGILFLKVLFVIVFNLFGTFILFMLGLLFLVRHLVLWILVILSPLAFLSFVLPATKKVLFDRWRKEFINWTFIGVIGTFFIYLSQLMLSVGMAPFQNNQPATETSGYGGTWMNSLMIMLVPFIFLLIGYFVTISSSAMGASAVIGLAKKGGNWVKGKGGAAAIGRLRGDLSKAAEPYKQAASTWANRVAKEQPTAWGRSTVQQIIGQRVRQGVARQVLRGTTASDSANVKKETEKYDNMSAEQRTLELRAAIASKDAVKQLAVVLSKAKNQDRMTGFDQEIRNAMEFAMRTNDRSIVKKTMQINPAMAQEMWQGQWNEFHGLELEEQAALRAGNANLATKRRQQRQDTQSRMDSLGMWLEPEDYAKYINYQGREYEAKVMDGMKEKDIPNMSEDYIKSGNAQQLIHEFWRGSQIGTAARTFERAFVEAFNGETLRRDNPANPTYYYYDNRPQVWRYLQGNTAQELGFIAPRGRGRLQPPTPPTPPTPPGPPGPPPGGPTPPVGPAPPGGPTPPGGPIPPGTGGGTILTPPSRGHVKMTSRPRFDARQRAEIEETRKRKWQEAMDKKRKAKEEAGYRRPGDFWTPEQIESRQPKTTTNLEGLTPPAPPGGPVSPGGPVPPVTEKGDAIAQEREYYENMEEQTRRELEKEEKQKRLETETEEAQTLQRIKMEEAQTLREKKTEEAQTRQEIKDMEATLAKRRKDIEGAEKGRRKDIEGAERRRRTRIEEAERRRRLKIEKEEKEKRKREN